jgi:prepilin-type processing-associated H-X9-DG protein
VGIAEDHTGVTLTVAIQKASVFAKGLVLKVIKYEITPKVPTRHNFKSNGAIVEFNGLVNIGYVDGNVGNSSQPKWVGPCWRIGKGSSLRARVPITITLE